MTYQRLFHPKSIAIVGGGAWCRAVIEQLIKSDYDGEIWPVHPRATELCGLPTFAALSALPCAPDAAFVGINRDATLEAVQTLSSMKAGGAVCFASGFGETHDGQDTNTRLLAAAGDMPILGPNCYGMINALDGVSLWPDQHACLPVQTGVAILTQSSNIAINLTMQKRGLHIAYVVTCGNQAQQSMADIAASLLDDPRVTAIGLHIEGFKDLAAWQSLAHKAHEKSIPLVALKVGKSLAAQTATVSHTASLAGSDAGASALLAHLGIARVDDLTTLLETLKILHVAGPLASPRIASISCSGGEASLIADLAHHTALTFPPLSQKQHKNLSEALGPKVALANPLDYHTYIWRDTEAMTAAFSAMIEPDLALTFLIVDFPRADMCDDSDWECAINAALQTRAQTGGTIAMVATLPELLPESVAVRLMAGGVIPLNGLTEAVHATVAAQKQTLNKADLIVPTPHQQTITLLEDTAKTDLAAFGLSIPSRQVGPIDALAAFAEAHTGPFVLKSVGSAHKSDTGGVALNLKSPKDLHAAASKMQGDTFLLETMITDPLAELLIGIVKDSAHGFVLTLAAGGIYTELLQDRASLLVPATVQDIEKALMRLKMAPVLTGYRNKPAADISTIITAIDAIQSYVLANLDTVEEVEINPLIVTQTQAIAVDALIRKRP